MKLHEFQAKEILATFGINIPKNHLLLTTGKSPIKIPLLKYPTVIKSQILAGGRGKANLVQIVKNEADCHKVCEWMLTQKLMDEKPVGLLFEELISFDNEYYFSLVLNRGTKNLFLIFSPLGGIDIENISISNPEKIYSFNYNVNNDFFIQEIKESIGFSFKNQNRLNNFINFMNKIISLYFSYDATLIEINPFVFDEMDRLVCLDCVFEVDDSAEFRQQKLFIASKKLHSKYAENPQYSNFGHHYQELEGSTGIIGCGAGIVMASMDMITKFGGTPANFLDLGGGANKEVTLEALNLLNKNVNIKCVFINIFGGITFCDEIAKAIIEYRTTHFEAIPMVIRMMGNNSELAIQMLKENGIFAFDSMEKAALTAVEVTQKQESSFFITASSRVIVQGITGKYGSYHTKKMLEYGTKLVAGVTPGKGGSIIHGLKVFDTVQEIVKTQKIDASVVFVPAQHVLKAVTESIVAKIPLIVIITEHVPIHDTFKIINLAKQYQVRIIGPNCPGIIRVNQANLGIIPGNILKKGNVAIISKSGTLLYEISSEISKHTKGVSTAIGLGGDPLTGTSIIETISYFLESEESKFIVYVGEIGGGEEEERLAEHLKSVKKRKPVIVFFAGDSAPKGSKMGHAGAIISGEKSTNEYKRRILRECGCLVADLPSDIYKIINQLEEKECPTSIY